MADRASPQTSPLKPVWPYPDIVGMTPQLGARQWSKKIGGRRHYFGPLDDPDVALATYRLDIEAIRAGRPRPSRTAAADTPGPRSLRTDGVVAAALSFKRQEAERGSLSPRTLLDYADTAEALLDNLPAAWEAVTPEGFSGMVNTVWGHLSPRVRKRRVIEAKLLLRLGSKLTRADMPDLDLVKIKVPRASPRRDRFSGKQIRLMLDTVDVLSEKRPVAWATMRAEILLAINAGMLQNEIATALEEDVRGEWIDSLRTKTSIPHVAWLWPETRAAIQDARAVRSKVLDGSPLLLCTPRGTPLAVAGSKTDSIGERFATLLGAAGIESGTFRWFRYTVRKVLSQGVAGVGDLPVARRFIMAHAVEDVHDAYAQGEAPYDDIRKCCEHLRAYALGPG